MSRNDPLDPNQRAKLIRIDIHQWEKIPLSAKALSNLEFLKTELGTIIKSWSLRWNLSGPETEPTFGEEARLRMVEWMAGDPRHLKYAKHVLPALRVAVDTAELEQAGTPRTS